MEKQVGISKAPYTANGYVIILNQTSFHALLYQHVRFIGRIQEKKETVVYIQMSTLGDGSLMVPAIAELLPPTHMY